MYITREKNENNHIHSFWKIGLEKLFLRSFLSKMHQKRKQGRSYVWILAWKDPHAILFNRNKDSA